MLTGKELRQLAENIQEDAQEIEYNLTEKKQLTKEQSKCITTIDTLAEDLFYLIPLKDKT